MARKRRTTREGARPDRLPAVYPGTSISSFTHALGSKLPRWVRALLLLFTVGGTAGAIWIYLATHSGVAMTIILLVIYLFDAAVLYMSSMSTHHDQSGDGR